MYTPIHLLIVVVLNAIISAAASASLIAEAGTIAVRSASKTMADLDYVHSLGAASAPSGSQTSPGILIYWNLNCHGPCGEVNLGAIALTLHLIQDQPDSTVSAIHVFRDFTATQLSVVGRTLTLHGNFRDASTGGRNEVSLTLEDRGESLAFTLNLSTLYGPIIGAVLPARLVYDVECTDTGCSAVTEYTCDCNCSFCEDFAATCSALDGGPSTDPDGTVVCTFQEGDPW